MQKVILTGFGFMGTMHAQIYQKLEQVRIVAIVDNNTTKAKQAMDQLNIQAPLFSNLESALDSVDATFVDICLPTDLHTESALLAINAGKHLFCEKPIALSVDEALLISTSANKAGITAQVGHCIRFWPEYEALRQFIQKGSAGSLQSLTLQRRSSLPDHSINNWLLDPKRSGGAVVDLHIHDTDFVLYLLGAPNAVYSSANIDSYGPSHILTQYKYPEVIVASEGGWNYPSQWGFQMAFQANFENGAIEYDSAKSPTLVLTDRNNERRALPFKVPEVGQSSTGAGNISALGGYFNELKSFISSLEAGQKPVTASLENATESLKVVLAELESARSGKLIPL